MKNMPALSEFAVEADIHPTAIVDDGVSLGYGVKIGPYCIVRAPAKLCDEVELKSHVIIEGHTTIGSKTIVHPFAVLGAPTPDRKYKGEPSELIIGERNVIREYVTMHPGTADDKMKTVIGDDNLILERVHIAHDCKLGNKITLVNSVGLSGHVTIEDNVTIGGMSGVTQHVRIGRGAFIGAHCKVEKDVMPNAIVRGEDGYMSGVNTIGLKRREVPDEQIKDVQLAYDKIAYGQGTLAERVQAVTDEFYSNPHVAQIIDFINTRKRGLTLPKS